jgi:hypothetical protein
MIQAINDLFEYNMENDVADIFNEYQEYIMDNGDPSEVVICNGDTLLQAAENEYLLEEFKQAWIAKLIC